MPRILHYKLLSIFMILSVIGVDRLSKLWVLDRAQFLPSFKINDFLNVVYIFNNGVSFGLFSQNYFGGKLVLITVIICIILCVLIVLLRSFYFLEHLACSFIIGGALGNLWDRMKYGAVFDFLDFHLYQYHWPSFNAADIFIVLGVILLFISQLLIFSKRF
ncbi:MAG: signal peptidase II [Alphaproteobacteria bacterium]